MNKRTLGKTGFSVGEVGLGCWQLGADWGNSITKDTAFSILQEAVDNGVNFFDTADVYGEGKSEKFIGDYIKTNGLTLIIATKFGRDKNTFPNNYTEEALRDSVNASLERLGLESLDLLQLHCIPIDVLRKGEIFNWLRTLKEEGLIKNFGASVETVEEGLICLEQEGLLSLQIIFNIFRQKPLEELLPKAKKLGVGIIVRLPLASGLLSGKFTKKTQFPDNDHRCYNQNGEAFNVGETFAGLPFKKGIELTNLIENNFLPKDMSMVQLALRWILDHEAVSCVIPGASSPSQVRSNAEVQYLGTLPLHIHKALSEFYTKEIHQNIRGNY